jgi:HipA-like C-terminal domain
VLPKRVGNWAEIVDTSRWQEADGEQRGLRLKRWMLHDGEKWLRKAPRGFPKTPWTVEPIVEALTLHMASQIGIEVAECRLATWSQEFNDQTHRVVGIVSRNMSGERELTAGRDLMFGASERVDIVQATIERARATVEHADLQHEFLRHLFFDAWIGNADRHSENWSVLRVRGRRDVLAPMYDTAGCLGCELQTDDELNRRAKQIRGYAENCPSGFGHGKTRMPMIEVIRALREWPTWAQVQAELLPKIHGLLLQLPALLAHAPESYAEIPLVTPVRRNFIETLLNVRVRMLE